MNARYHLWIASLINSVPTGLYWALAMLLGGFNPGIMGLLFLALTIVSLAYVAYVTRPR